jgi:hypothetical protein
VFELVDAAQLTARPEDRLEDFTGGPDLMTSLAAGGPGSATANATAVRRPGR